MPGTTANDTNEADDTHVRGARVRRRLRLAGAGVAAAVALGVAAVTTTAASAAPAPPDTGAAELRAAGVAGGPARIPNPGPGYRITSVYKVTSGTQTYTCNTAADGTLVWGPASTPEARLRRYLSRDRIHHFAGPRWASEKDGSTIVGRNLTDHAVPQPGTIPWLLLEVTAHEGPAGELSPVTHISRIRTSGGAAPTRPCTAGETRAVSYGADYVFWTKAR
ncbi:DUF3455 domain-containing protein [Pseudonocardia lacus]|uniref:DUF3455 domain-containing protein n=1 Tax=Pseudonocardia lacus TaxID=2835865 RepID=UPI001BDD5E30|nr:DUF3455 domain-containing protein [Pseudonocardia lacus]